MGTILQLSGGMTAFFGLVFWFFGGPNFGWSRSDLLSRQITVNGNLESVASKHFVPGLDFVFGTIVVGACLFFGGRHVIRHSGKLQEGRNP